MYRHLPYISGIALAILSASVMPQETNRSTPLLVIEQSRSYGQGTFPRDASWLGLYCEETECELQSTQVRVTSSSAKNVLDEDEPLDVLAVTGKPLALFPDMPLKAGKVVSWYRAKEPSSDTYQAQKLKKLGKWDMPWGTRPLTISWVRTPEGWKRYHVSDGNTKQFLFRTELEGHYGGDTTPIIHWVGDLDGDGKSDILLSIPDDNCGFDERLYLSSNAAEGKLLRKAAQLSGDEAACGC